ncbi:MAG: phosphate:Na+ symporter [Chlamydiales bacterium]|jgi:phosphate:Na+ symporter
MDSFAGFIAGFAFFLVGLKLFSTNLNQITSKRFRTLITRFTPNDWLAGMWGVLLSLLTAGNTVLTPCITAGFESVHAINFRKAIQIVLWSRVGACFFIYLAGFNIKLLVLILMGFAGISFAINKPKHYNNLTSSIFNLGLVLFGIQLIKGSSKVLIKLDWFHNVIEYTQQFPEIAFIAGILFILGAQSLFGALVVALSFIDSGIFDIQQAILFTYGVYLGEAILKTLHLTSFKGIFKQVMCLLPIIYFATFLTGILTYIANAMDFPFIQHYAHIWASSPKQELAHLNFGIHLFTVSLLSIGVLGVEALVYALLGKPKTEEVKAIDIPDGILDDPIMTMTLIEQEKNRLIHKFPNYLENIRSGESQKEPLTHNNLHCYLKENLEDIHDIFNELLERSHYHPEISAQLLLAIERQNLLSALEENLYNFSITVDFLREQTKSNVELSNKFLNFAEAMDATLLTMIDVLDDPKESFNLDALMKITSGREDFMKDIREQYSSQLAITEKVELISLVNLFESNIWIVKKIANSVYEGEFILEETTAKAGA